MPRIAGVDIPGSKQIEIGLTYIFGIGRNSSKNIVEQASVDPSKLSNDLTDHEIAKIRDIIEKHYMVEGDLKQDVQQNIRRLIEIGSYRGLRHKVNLPTRGQRTKSNARTRKGPRGTAIAKKKKIKG
ncbi:MAG: 30S ribosomal protein S13 [Candidatus Dadabacteria bacterium]|nr:30S ribosomal protein S13 [Candidatus Dadabacteria bacterium]